MPIAIQTAAGRAIPVLPNLSHPGETILATKGVVGYSLPVDPNLDVEALYVKVLADMGKSTYPTVYNLSEPVMMPHSESGTATPEEAGDNGAEALVTRRSGRVLHSSDSARHVIAKAQEKLASNPVASISASEVSIELPLQ